MSKKKKGTIWLFLILAFLIFCFWRVYISQTSPPSSQERSIEFTIKSGESVEVIAADLKKNGLIKNPFFFRLVLVKEGLAGKIQAGLFILSPNLSAPEVAHKLTAGFSDIQATFPEGWRVEEIADELSKKLLVVPADFIKAAREGEMFPDTYRFKSDAKASDVAGIMLANFNSKFDQKLATDAQSLGFSKKEVLILASIVEREAKFSQDRPIVAGILEKRYEIGMALEVDATLQYALGYSADEKTWWRKSLTADDLDSDSPYNTRKFAGLPPGPICSPGLEAIKAVIDPKETDHLYYVSDKKGNMHYAATLDEHVQNIKDYL